MDPWKTIPSIGALKMELSEKRKSNLTDYVGIQII
jgi:hypothetical protein